MWSTHAPDRWRRIGGHSVDMRCVSQIGLLKMDFLGLTNLTVIEDALQNVKETRGLDIDIDNVHSTT